MAIRWDKLTVKSQEAIQSAGTLAAESGNPEVLPLHILAVLLEDSDGIIVPLLQKVGAPTEQLLMKVNQALTTLPKVSGSGAQPGLSNAAQKVLDQAFKEA
jgi:ATP-dependent Clp protease ATP-binding subunit ClpB